MDGAGDIVDGHASVPEKPGQVPGMDTREDVPHLVTLDRRHVRGTKDPGEFDAGWAVRVAGQVAARKMGEEGAHLLRGSGGRRKGLRMLEPRERQGISVRDRELGVHGVMTRRLSRPSNESAVHAERPFARVSSAQDAVLNIAQLGAGVKLLAGGEVFPCAGLRVGKEVANLRKIEHLRSGAVSSSQLMSWRR